MNLKNLLIIAFLFSCLPYHSFAQDKSINPLALNTKDNSKHKTFLFTLGTGISDPIKGGRYWNEDWRASYVFSGSLFAYLNQNVLFGVRCAYNNWAVNETEITKNYPSSVAWASIKGNTNILEIVPSFRFILSDEFNKTNIFFQFGAGSYMLKGNYNLSGSFQFDSTSPTVTYAASDNYKFSKPGLSMGYGIKGGKFEILPLYNVIFTDRDPTHYVTFNLSLSF